MKRECPRRRNAKRAPLAYKEIIEAINRRNTIQPVRHMVIGALMDFKVRRGSVGASLIKIDMVNSYRLTGDMIHGTSSVGAALQMKQRIVNSFHLFLINSTNGQS